jgi:hypothetical protein
MATIAMSIDGVLTTENGNENILNTESSNAGKVLYSALKETSRLLLLSNDPSKDRVKSWLARERFTRYADVHCYPIDTNMTYAEWRVKHIKDMIGIGHNISFFIDADPEAVGKALEAGVNSMLVAFPGVIPGRMDKEYEYSPWYSLVDTIEQQSMLRASRFVEDEVNG